MQHYTVSFIWKPLYMFRVVPPPIIRSANNFIYSIWYLSHRCCYLPLSQKSWNCRAYAVDTVVCAPDDGWRYHPKHVEQFPDKINCVTLHLLVMYQNIRIVHGKFCLSSALDPADECIWISLPFASEQWINTKIIGSSFVIHMM